MLGPSHRETRSAVSHTGRCVRILSRSLYLSQLLRKSRNCTLSPSILIHLPNVEGRCSRMTELSPAAAAALVTHHQPGDQSSCNPRASFPQPSADTYELSRDRRGALVPAQYHPCADCHAPCSHECDVMSSVSCLTSNVLSSGHAGWMQRGSGPDEIPSRPPDPGHLGAQPAPLTTCVLLHPPYL